MDGLRARHLLGGAVLVLVGAAHLAASSWAATTSILQPVWRAEVAGAAALAVSEKLVVVAAQNRVKAFALEGGAVAFDVDAGGKALAVSADSRSVVVTVAGVGASVLDAASGVVRFNRQRADGYLYGVAAGDLVVLARGGRRAGVEALGSQDGRRLWRRDLRSQAASAPAVTDSRVFAADETFVHAFRRRDGAPRWRFALGSPATPLPLQGAVALSGTAPQFVTSVGAARGALRWAYRLEQQASLAPVAAEGSVFVAAPLPGDEGGPNRTLVRALNANDGSLTWTLALPGEVTHLVASRGLLVAAAGSSLHTISAQRGLLLESLDFGEPIRRLGGGTGSFVVLGESGKLEAFTGASTPAAPSVTERELAQLVPGGPAQDALETLALQFARREIESAIGEALSPSGVLVVSRKVAADPLLQRPVVALEILAEDGYLCRAKVAADGLEVLSWSNPRASAASDYVDVSQAQAAELTRPKAPLPDGAALSFARVEVDSEGKAYLDARWSAPGARAPQMEMRLHPRTGALISLVALWKLPEPAVARWRQELSAYRSPSSRGVASVAVEGEPRSPLPGEIRHHRMSSQAYDVAFDGTSFWVTTNGGLYRVDPKTGEHHRITTRDGLLDNELTALVSEKSALWAASARGLTRVREGRVERYPFELPELRGREPKVRQLVQGGADEVWAATNAGVVRWKQGLYTWFGKPHGLFNENVRGLARDPKGVLWAATEEGLARFDGERWDVFREVDGLPQNDTMAVLVDRRGRVWVATAESGVGRFDGSKWRLFKKQTAYGVPAELGPPSDRIRDLALDTPGAVWGVHEEGLTRYFERRWLSFPLGGVVRGRALSRVILGDRRMICVARGPGQGLVAFNGRAWLPEFVPPDRNEPPAADWVVASGEALFVGARAFGVGRYLGRKWERHNVDQGPHSGVLRASDSAAPDGRGGLWVGARGALCRYDGQRWTCSGEGVGAHPVVSLSTDNRGVLWVGTSDAGVKRLEGDRWAHFTEEHGLPSLEVRQVLAAPDQAVFALVAGPRGRSALVRMPAGLRKFQVLGEGVGLAAAPTALALDREGKVYVATAAATLLRWEGNQFVPERRYDGLPPAPIHRLVFDRQNHPWVIHDRGQGARHHDGQTWVPFTRRTGLISDGARDLAVDAQGTVWVATDEGLTEYAPKE